MAATKINPWTPDLVDRLKQLADEGLAPTEIAKELGMTRNAVIGKMTRAGIKRSPPASQALPAPEPEVIAPVQKLKLAPPAFMQTPSIAEPAELPPNVGVTFDELGFHHCRFVIGHMRYCGVQRLGSLPYCAGHARICYQHRGMK
jgi:GcrA cell cycle regulator